MKIEYEIIRSSRKTICISIIDNKVIVRAPYRTSIKRIENFVEKKRSWIIKNISGQCLYDELCTYKYVLVKGVKVPLNIGDVNTIKNDCVIVRRIDDLKNLYIDYYSKEFLELFDDISLSCGLNAKSVAFKGYKSRWGCCNAKKQIIFNFKLLMLPVELWQCVIVHELCHTVFMDHSQNFHKLAESIMPNFKARELKLKNYSAVARLY